MPNRTETETYDYAAFSVLAYEFRPDDPKLTDKKIRSALKRKQLGPFDEARVGMLRELKNELQGELQQAQSSAYFRGPTSKFASPEDFDQAKLTDDLSGKYSQIERNDLGRMVSLALYVYYLR